MGLEEIRRLVRGALGIMPTLDLHGFGVKDALQETERYLADAQAHGLGSVKIVTGKGHGSPGKRGVLREVVPKWLDTAGQPYVRRWERCPDASGAHGGLIVWVRLDAEDEEPA